MRSILKPHAVVAVPIDHDQAERLSRLSPILSGKIEGLNQNQMRNWIFETGLSMCEQAAFQALQRTEHESD